MKKILFSLTVISFLITSSIFVFADTKDVNAIRQKAIQGDADAQHKMGRMYLSINDLGNDPVKASKWFLKAARQGHSGAQNGMGNRYKWGLGVPQSDTEAFKWFNKAAKQGNSNSHLMLGSLYYNGEGVPVDYIKAYAWWYLVETQDKWEVASENLTLVKKKMTPEQISQAKALTAELLKKMPKKKK